MPVRILMVNVHSCQNSGDAALLDAAVRQLQRHFPGCQVTLAMNDPGSYRGEARALGSLTAWVKRVDPARRSRWAWWALPWLPLAALLLAMAHWAGGRVLDLLPRGQRDLIRAYYEADLIVSCPGGYLYSAPGVGLPLTIAVYSMALAAAAGKPLYLLPQSIGPLTRPFDRWLVGWVLKRARLVMLREAVSWQQLPLAPAARQKVVQLPDMALIFESVPRAEAERWLAGQNPRPEADRPLLGMTAINWQAQSAFRGQASYEQALAAAARYFIEQCGGWVILLPQVCGPSVADDDRVPASRVAERLGPLASRVVVVHDPLSPALQKSACGLMDVFIGTRMHSNIFAASYGVPTLPIGYQYKTRGIAQVLGLDEWVLEIDGLSSDRLVERLGDLWSRRERVRADLLQRLPGLRHDAEQAGALIAADFASLGTLQKTP
jgi:colanic acid/amylovoran biosynthesis protein